MTAQTDPRRCHYVYPDGRTCLGWRTQTGYCGGHSRIGIAANPSESAKRANESRKIRHRERAERKRRDNLTLKEALAARAADERDRIIEALFAGLDADSPRERQRAAELIVTRILGRPNVAIEQPADLPDITVESLVALWNSPESESDTGE